MTEPASATTNGSSPVARPRRATARGTVEATLDNGRAMVRETAGAVRAKANEAAESGAVLIDASPLTALAGAIAVGAVAAALIPATRQEFAAIGPLGERVRNALDEAFNAAKAAGAEQFTATGLTSTALSTGLGGIVSAVIKASLAASTAARSEIREPATTGNQA